MTDRPLPDDPILTRRRFLALAAAFTAPLVPGAVAGVAALGDPTGAAADRLTAPLAHRESAAHIGRAYLRTNPAEADPGRLVQALVASLADDDVGPRDPLTTDDGELKARVARRIAAEFAARDVALVDGWVLSRTEARLCALVALA